MKSGHVFDLAGPEASPGSKAGLEDTKPGHCVVSAAAANFMITSIGAMTAAGMKPREGTEHVQAPQYSSSSEGHDRNTDERSEPSNPERPISYASPAPSVSPANFQNYPGFVVDPNPNMILPDDSPARSIHPEYAFTPVNYAQPMGLSGYHSAPNFSTDADPFSTSFACGRGTVVSPTPRKPQAVSSLKKQQPKSRSSAGKIQAISNIHISVKVLIN